MKRDPLVTATRKMLKIERIIRLELAGFSDSEISMHVDLSRNYISVLRMTPEFVRRRMEIATGVISEYDNNLLDGTKVAIEELKQMVPSAVMVMRNALLDGRNPKLQFEASKEILDREGTLAKVSKSEIKKTSIFDFSTNDAIAKDLLSALQDNISSADQTEAQAIFVNTAEQSIETQTALNASLNLVDLDTSNLQVQ